MSRKDEDRILHGLHFYRESLDEEFTVTNEQVLWLAAHSFSEGASWYVDDDFQSFDCSVVPAELRAKLLMSKFELPVRYLQYRRLIKFTPVGDDAANIAVTFAGADRATRLHTLLGRLDIWYQEHKDGLLGLLMTVAVSCLTALLTVALIERLHRSFSDPPRPIYEADPK